MNSASRPASVTLLLPGARVPQRWFDEPAFRAAVERTALAQRLQRAALPAPWQDRAPTPTAVAHQRWLLDWLGLSSSGALDAASAHADAVTGAAFRLHPVSLRAGIDRVSLVALHDDSLPLEQARALAASAEALLAEDGWQVRVAESGRWYLTGAAGLEVRTCAPEVALGRSVDAYQPAGADARRWRQRLAEVEMAWHLHPVNAAREADGLAAVNSLWLTGPVPTAARLPDASGEPSAHSRGDALVLTDLPSVAGAARLQGARVRDLADLDDAQPAREPTGPDGGQASEPERGRSVQRVLIAPGGLLEPLLARDPQAWLAAFESVAGRSLALATRIARHMSAEVELVLCGDLTHVGVPLRASNRWWLWRRGSVDAAFGEADAQRDG